jgi:hypothetical protein
MKNLAACGAVFRWSGNLFSWRGFAPLSNRCDFTLILCLIGGIWFNTPQLCCGWNFCKIQIGVLKQMQ